MQSTSNTTSAPMMRPKIGRPPPIEVPRPPQEEELTEFLPPAPEATHRRDPRLWAFSVCLVLAMTLVLSRIITPSIHNAQLADMAPSIPPIVINAQEVAMPPAVTTDTNVAAAAPAEPALVGTLTTIGAQDNPASFQATAGSAQDAPQPVIDKQDRQRLLSILSKD